MSKTYRLLVADENQTYAMVDGNIDLVAYAARKLNLGTDESYDVKLTETHGFNEDSFRTVLALTADGDTVATLLGSKIRKERKTADETPASLPVVDDGRHDEVAAEPAFV